MGHADVGGGKDVAAAQGRVARHDIRTLLSRARDPVGARGWEKKINVLQWNTWTSVRKFARSAS